MKRRVGPQRSALMREADRLDRDVAARRRDEREAERAANCAYDDRRYDDVDGLPRWVRSAMRGPTR